MTTNDRDDRPLAPRQGATRRTFLQQASLAAGGVLIGSAVTGQPALAQTPRRGGTLKLVHSKMNNINPAIQSGIATMVPGAQIFAGLVQYDAEWHPQPYLATQWETAKDGLSYTFHLRDDATFHDGTPVTAEDVAFSLQTVKANHPFGVAMFGGVSGVDTPDAHTAVIRLAHPVPSLLISTSSVLLPIIPKHVYDNGPIRTNPANVKPVGSGPFKLKAYDPAQYLILERYEHFFRPDRPYLDELIFQFMDDPSAIMIAMSRGEMQYWGYADQQRNIMRLEQQSTLGTTRKGYEAIGPLNWLAFNVRSKPLSDVKVRQAIAYAIDKNFIINKLFLGRAKDATGPIAPDGFFYDGKVERYAFNLDKANQLLDEAGYKRQANGTRFSLTLDWNPQGGNEEATLPAQYLKSQLPKVGIAIELRPSADFPSWAKRIANWDFELTMDEVFNYPDPVIGVQRTYICDNIKKGVIWSNTQGFCDPEVDKTFAAAALEVDPAKRKALYAEVQKRLADELPVYWLNEIAYTTVYDKRLRNLPLTIWGAMGPFDEVYWGEKTG